MQKKLVSIIVPTYNRADLIGETIQSVIDQTYKNWELIIVDDGSTDDSKNYITKFNDERIVYYAIEHCGILGKVRNVGISHAKGDYIAFLDSDDLWLPQKLEYQLTLLQQYPTELESLFVGNIFLPLLLEERFVFYVPTVLFKKKNLEETGLISESMVSGGDIHFFLKMAHRFEGIFSNKIIVKIRKHKQSHSDSLESVANQEYIEMIQKFRHEKLLTSNQFGQLASKQYYKLGLIHLKKGDGKKALQEFIKYVRLNPFRLNGWFRISQCALAYLKL
jgi:glycosyltransferase involved in cell wall biosynthesis